MSSLLRKVSHHELKKVSTLVRSRTYESDLTKLDKILPVCIADFSHVVKLTSYKSYRNVTFHIHTSSFFQ